MVSRTNRELSAEDIGCIADTYHAWRGEDADLNRMRTSPASRMRTSWLLRRGGSRRDPRP
jgi:hypothetical protein